MLRDGGGKGGADGWVSWAGCGGGLRAGRLSRSSEAVEKQQEEEEATCAETDGQRRTPASAVNPPVVIPPFLSKGIR
ncbi:hypothetical protein CKAH01_13004 [Colletotrichum kahawae]|uniref:Uncharacterized protein n=1 Tax=Colletotrichum kahawae TaxID=34407 RepID=A0AAD9YPE3_COLKA|nr:hypothetical protein CKAH01_13004 [Colletotrichum kahawae]